MPPHDRLDLARVLLARAIDDETLVRKVSPQTPAALALVEQVRTWAENELETVGGPQQPPEEQPQ